MNDRVSYLLLIPLLGFLAIVQSVVGPRLNLLNVRPDLILLIVIAWTLFKGSRSGIVWGFVGGLWMDVLSGGPMGGSSLALMAASLVTGIGHNRFFRSNPLVPVVAAVLGTFCYSFTYLVILDLIGHRFSFADTVAALVMPAVLYNSVLMLLLTPWLRRWLEQRDVETLE